MIIICFKTKKILTFHENKLYNYKYFIIFLPYIKQTQIYWGQYKSGLHNSAIRHICEIVRSCSSSVMIGGNKTQGLFSTDYFYWTVAPVYVATSIFQKHTVFQRPLVAGPIVALLVQQK